MKDILVILTGGTIGSCSQAGFIAPAREAAYDLIRMYEETSGKVGRFECVQPFTILSENASPDVWSDLVRTLSYIDLSAYKGVIITHGTDTLSYTAAFLGILYEGLVKCPIVLVSSNAVLTKQKSNGLQNFSGAVDLIDHLSLTGMYNDVYVSWASDFFEIIRASELTEADTASDDFGIYGDQAFLEFYPDGINLETGGYAWRPVPNNMHDNRCLAINGTDERQRIIEGRTDIKANVLAIRPYPGLNYSLINIEGYDAVMVYSYHSSTFCTDAANEALNIQVLVEKCRREGKTLYLASFKEDAAEVYESLKKLKLYDNTVKLFSQSFESAYVNAVIAESLKK